MRVVFAGPFFRQIKKLPNETKEKIRKQIKFLSENLQHPSLRAKKYKDFCYTSQAMQKDDPTQCEKIGYIDSKYSCYTDVARSKKDFSLCNEIGDPLRKKQCYFIVASDTKDASICDKITGNLKSTCRAEVGK